MIHNEVMRDLIALKKQLHGKLSFKRSKKVVKTTEKLKTLEDFKWEAGGELIPILRQEVIKWIKKLEYFSKNIFNKESEISEFFDNQFDDFLANRCNDKEHVMDYSGTIAWIKWFFNIKEEDLA